MIERLKNELTDEREKFEKLLENYEIIEEEN